MVEENFEIWFSETLQISLILLLFDDHYFTMVEETFEIWHYEMLQIGLILLHFDNHYFNLVEELHHMVEENFEIWNAPDWLNFTTNLCIG